MIIDARHSETNEATRDWLQGVVLKHNLCPFAHKPWRDGTVRIVASDASSEAALIEDLCNEIHELLLIKPEDRETTVIAVSQILKDFDAYLDFVDVANNLLSVNSWEGELQIASFHPDYVFEGSNEEDPGNYTNRAPFPLLHLIREASITQAVEGHPDIERIPERNVRLLETMDEEHFAEVLMLSLARQNV